MQTGSRRPSENDESIDHCGQCQSRVALVRPHATLPASPWRCRNCGAVYLAALERREGSHFRGGVLPATYSEAFFPATLQGRFRRAALSPEDILQLKRCIPNAVSEDPSRRHQPRHAVATGISILAVEHDFRIVGMPASGCTIDVSCGGLSLLHPEPTTAPYFAVDFSPSHSLIPPVLFRPTRCWRLTSAYAVAGEFVCRIEC